MNWTIDQFDWLTAHLSATVFDSLSPPFWTIYPLCHNNTFLMTISQRCDDKQYTHTHKHFLSFGLFVIYGCVTFLISSFLSAPLLIEFNWFVFAAFWFFGLLYYRRCHFFLLRFLLPQSLFSLTQIHFILEYTHSPPRAMQFFSWFLFSDTLLSVLLSSSSFWCVVSTTPPPPRSSAVSL